MQISYLNTDLDLVSSSDLTSLAEALEKSRVFPLHVTQSDDGLWRAIFETGDQYSELEPNIAALVAVIEALAEPHRSEWWGCTQRELNIGYDCGPASHAFHQALSNALLCRVVAVGASLRVTIYPMHDGDGE